MLLRVRSASTGVLWQKLWDRSPSLWETEASMGAIMAKRLPNTLSI